MDSNFVGSGVVLLKTLFGHDVMNTSKIHNKFILCWKNIISMALIVSHTCLYVGKIWKIWAMAWDQTPNFDHNGMFCLRLVDFMLVFVEKTRD